MSDLTELISKCANEAPVEDVAKLAHTIAEETPGRRLREFYAEALKPLVRIVLGNERNRAAADVRRGRTYSRKTQDFRESRDAWEVYLGAIRAVGGGLYKPMRDCTVADLDFIIKTRENHITSVQIQLDHDRRIREAMIAQGVKRVGQLSGPVE